MTGRAQEYRQRFADQAIRFNPYTIKKMGLLQSQTILQLQDYMLICAPYQMSIRQIVLLVILSGEEIKFFQQFQKKAAGLTISFQKSGTASPLDFQIRGNLTRIGPVKGKTNVCMLDVSYSDCPDELVEIIGDNLLAFQSLKGQYESFKNRTMEINELTAQVLRFNNYVESQIGGQKVQTRLVSLSAGQIILEIPAAVRGLQEGQKIFSKLYFQTYQFVVNGQVVGIENAARGDEKATINIAFSPELVEILDDYFFRESFNKKE